MTEQRAAMADGEQWHVVEKERGLPVICSCDDGQHSVKGAVAFGVWMDAPSVAKLRQIIADHNAAAQLAAARAALEQLADELYHTAAVSDEDWESGNTPTKRIRTIVESLKSATPTSPQ